eukprot:357392-Chlamydomonas_euryale.AAC.51
MPGVEAYRHQRACMGPCHAPVWLKAVEQLRRHGPKGVRLDDLQSTRKRRPSARAHCTLTWGVAGLSVILTDAAGGPAAARRRQRHKIADPHAGTTNGPQRRHAKQQQQRPKRQSTVCAHVRCRHRCLSLSAAAARALCFSETVSRPASRALAWRAGA